MRYSFAYKFKYIPISNNENILLKQETEQLNINTLLYYVLPYTDHNKIIPTNIYNNTKDDVYKHIPFLKNTNYNVEYFLCKYFWECHLDMDYINITELNNIINNLNI